uniref:WDR59/RTC1-like RING zinc finger domain-containing protein n=1 Tax=Plectus sambesii TaxID=2011161 RepID=A0A914WG71_9BILA
MGHVTEEIRHYKDIQATALDSDPTGRFLCLAGKRFLSVVLADPAGSDSVVCSKKSRSARLDVSNVRWRSNNVDTPYIVLSSGQNIELYAIEADTIKLVESLRAHPRNVTDVDWSNFDPNSFVTSSVDDAVSVWDVRELRRPSVSLHVVAGAVQAKWAPLMHYMLATAHGTDVRVWDIRKFSSPVQSIPAHLDKINSLVWHPKEDMCFATSSQDGNLKLWEFSNASKPRLAAGLLPIPAWKVRFTRNGAGLVTLPVPQGGRGPNALNLWRSADFESVQSLQGHTDLIQDACWRPLASDSGECQLFSVAKDHTLRSWLINNHVFAAERGEDALTLSATEELFEGERMVTPTEPPTDDWSRWVVAPSKVGLMSELEALSSLRLVGITTDEINFDRAAVGITFERDGNAVKLVIRFHAEYATNGKVHLQILRDESSLSAIGASQLLKQMQELCQEKTTESSGDVIMANVLRQIPSMIDGLMLFDGHTIGSIEKSPSVLTMTGSNTVTLLRPPPLRSSLSMPPSLSSYDRHVPSPRTCGGKFNGSGILVYFGLFEYGRAGNNIVTTSPQTPTPRSLDEYGGSSAAIQMLLPKSASNYFTTKHNSSISSAISTGNGSFSTMRNRGISLGNGLEHSISDLRASSSNSESAVVLPDGVPISPSFVTLYDICGLFPISKELAKVYSLMNGSPMELCATNRASAAALGRSDLAVIWTLLEQCLDPKLKPILSPDLGTPWAVNPFGRPLINSLLDFCSRTGDFQTAAMISCILGQRSRFSQRKGDGLSNARSASSSCSGDVPQAVMGAGSVYNTIHCENNLMPPATDNNFLTLANRPRSSSFDDDVSPPQSPPRQFLSRPPSFNTVGKEKEVLTEQEQHDNQSKLLDPALSHRLENIRLVYADILSRWNMHSKAAEVLKYCSTKPTAELEPMYVTNCNRCDNNVRYGMKCEQCNALAFRCCLCQMPVKGLWSVCPVCRHGGHVSHMEDWFTTYEFCPAGCGCSCLRLFC